MTDVAMFMTDTNFAQKLTLSIYLINVMLNAETRLEISPIMIQMPSSLVVLSLVQRIIIPRIRQARITAGLT